MLRRPKRIAEVDACLRPELPLGEGSHRPVVLKREVMQRSAACLSMTGDYQAGLSVTACKTMHSRSRCNGQTEQ